MTMRLDARQYCLGASVPATHDDGGPPDPLCQGDLPAVSFAKDVAPIFSGCSGEVCHAPWRYGTTVGKSSTACCDQRWLIEPGRPSQSHIVQSLTDQGACVPRMPLGGELSDSAIATIVAWICQGAREN
jgi:hypothetical protein